jgi:hypothetical protein
MNEQESKAPLSARVLNPILSGVRDAQANIPNSGMSLMSDKISDIKFRLF